MCPSVSPTGSSKPQREMKRALAILHLDQRLSVIASKTVSMVEIPLMVQLASQAIGGG